jgi:hypothetical protein
LCGTEGGSTINLLSLYFTVFLELDFLVTANLALRVDYESNYDRIVFSGFGAVS